jgi:twitching motility two-component system response regulator PilH
MARILIIDDSPTEVFVLQKMIQNNGHQAMVAVDAEQGFDIAAKEKPDLILMDVVMPGISGFQATRKLSKDERTAGIPIVIVTGKNQESDRAWGLRQGAVDYITKPVNEKMLLAKIGQLVKG